jgi:hypothetical protein
MTKIVTMLIPITARTSFPLGMNRLSNSETRHRASSRMRCSTSCSCLPPPA